ncbi:transcription termination factor Rho [Allofustis seminis]|uniref:transcription termination factor Rho n=1 Tax=Allofustis seminis TaxID=166939 RepID=UPI000378B0E9|nr:transcription termination factor Rho [Allofustis seminis]
MKKDKFLTYDKLQEKTLKEIYEMAKALKIPYYSQMNKKELSFAVIRAQEEKQGYFQVSGILDKLPNQDFGFLRPINYSHSNEDVYISASQMTRFGLREGDEVAGTARPAREGERFYGLLNVKRVNDKNPEEARNRVHFPALTALYPNQKIKLETSRTRIAPRIIDLMAPIGFGQRGLIVAPPKAGKTTILKEIANGISQSYPDAELIMLLIDERPEEVTDIERSTQAEVVHSTFDQQPQNHIRIAELVLERARRLVEDRRDVVILMDSITRLARAYNLVEQPSGRTLSGGLDPSALYGPKRFFGSARNVEEGGSLTIISTALVDTGSRMDDVIYEEFKGTGNMELHLSRQLAERRIFPAIDILKSGTRKDELLLSEQERDAIFKIRRAMPQDALEFTENFVRSLRQTKDNQEFINQIKN